jgi:hypothetical protein
MSEVESVYQKGVDKMSKKEEPVEITVTVKVPQPLINVLEAWWKFVGYENPTVKEYLADEIKRGIPSLIGDIIFKETPDWAEAIIKHYRLEPYRKDFDVPKRI